MNRGLAAPLVAALALLPFSSQISPWLEGLTHGSGTVARAAVPVTGVLRTHLESHDVGGVLDRLTRLRGRPGEVVDNVPPCDTPGVCTTRFTPVAPRLAPGALAQALTEDESARASIETEAALLLERFRQSADGQSADVSVSVTFLLAEGSALQGRAPTPSQREAFRVVLERLLADEPAFRASTDSERQMTAELCGILGAHLQELGAEVPGRERQAGYARALVMAALGLDVRTFDWRAFDSSRRHRLPVETSSLVALSLIGL